MYLMLQNFHHRADGLLIEENVSKLKGGTLFFIRQMRAYWTKLDTGQLCIIFEETEYHS